MDCRIQFSPSVRSSVLFTDVVYMSFLAGELLLITMDGHTHRFPKSEFMGVAITPRIVEEYDV